MQMDGGDGEGGGEEGGPPRSPLAGGRPELLRTESIDPAKAAATMCSFKITPKENLQGSIDALWRRQGYMVHVDDMMQCSRHQAVLDEKVLTTLAKNILVGDPPVSQQPSFVCLRVELCCHRATG